MLFIALPVRAQEIFLLGGAVRNGEDDDISYAWQYEYLEGLGEHFSASLSYLNEGHFEGHHRDGYTAQLWVRSNILDRRLSLAAGVGPYYCSDTVRPLDDSSSFMDDHGLGVMASLSATWYTGNRWLFRLRANGIQEEEMNTISLVLGLGYQLESPDSRGPVLKSPSPDGRTTENELTVLYGKTIVNSFGSEHSPAVSVEYRRGLWKYVEWTIAWLGEGTSEMIDRSGFMTELWLAKLFFDDRITLGIGSGVYGAADGMYVEDEEGDNMIFSGVISLTGSYRFHPRWGVRVSWNRILTNYDRDTDVIFAGVGYLF